MPVQAQQNPLAQSSLVSILQLQGQALSVFFSPLSLCGHIYTHKERAKAKTSEGLLTVSSIFHD